MSDVCLPPGHGEASGSHHHPAGRHIQVRLHVVHPSHVKQEKKEGQMRKCPPQQCHLINFLYFYFWLDFAFLTCFFASCLFSLQHPSALSPDPWLCDFLYAVF